jgi:hypothetical protein
VFLRDASVSERVPRLPHRKRSKLEWAYHFVSDALRLFRTLGDRKGIGVASNNIANIMFVASLEKSPKRISPESPSSVKEKYNHDAASRHYDEAISIASMDLDQAALLDDKASHAQQLANRHFNRAMFHLRTAKEASSVDCKAKGYEDLEKARALDLDIHEYWLHHNRLMDISDIYFDRIIRRLRGLSMVSDDRRARDMWNVRELVEEGDQLLYAAWGESVPLFREFSLIGRLQMLESALIALELVLGNIEEAARISMRMITEDEYLLDSAFVTVADALFRFMNLESSNAPCWSP